jgi:hypothetical protein
MKFEEPLTGLVRRYETIRVADCYGIDAFDFLPIPHDRTKVDKARSGQRNSPLQDPGFDCSRLPDANTQTSHSPCPQTRF